MENPKLLSHWEQVKSDAERAVEYAQRQIAILMGEVVVEIVRDEAVEDAA